MAVRECERFVQTWRRERRRHTHAHTHSHTRTHAHTHTHMYTHTHTHTHTHTNTHTHTHTGIGMVKTHFVELIRKIRGKLRKESKKKNRNTTHVRMSLPRQSTTP